jgi:chromosome segregation ATPase
MDLFNKNKVEELQSELVAAESRIQALSTFENLEAEHLSSLVTELRAEKGQLDTDLQAIKVSIAESRELLTETNDLVILQEVGIYEYSTELDNAIGYKEKLKELDEKIKSSAKSIDGAINAIQGWTVNGSTQQGSKMIKEVSKLMLRAYNAEAEDAVRTLKPYKVDAAVERLSKVKTAIEKLGTTMQIEVKSSYHALRISEIRLYADFLAKQSEEKEAQRAEALRLKDELKAQKEYEAEKIRLNKEMSHHEIVLKKAEETGNTAAIEDARSKIEEITKAFKGVEERSANIRAGYVYVISNIGSFGEEIVKIGLTRRLDYEERIRELSDASVPFIFDVHAIVFSQDAVSLEKKLHDALAEKKLNKVNARKEFFRSKPIEVKNLLEDLADEHLLIFNEVPEAVEWRISEGKLRA